MNALKTNKRWLLWLPLLAIALWLAIFADKTPTGQVETLKLSSSNSISISQKISEPATVTTSKIMKNDLTSLEPLVDRATLIGENESQFLKWRNLFASSTWTPPPPPLPLSKPSAPIVEPAPTSPALPYLYIGKKLENNVWEVYLLRGDQSFLAREGVTLEGNYRVDAITPQRLTVTYLPLGQSQSLSIEEIHF